MLKRIWNFIGGVFVSGILLACCGVFVPFMLQPPQLEIKINWSELWPILTFVLLATVVKFSEIRFMDDDKWFHRTGLSLVCLINPLIWLFFDRDLWIWLIVGAGLGFCVAYIQTHGPDLMQAWGYKMMILTKQVWVFYLFIAGITITMTLLSSTMAMIGVMDVTISQAFTFGLSFTVFGWRILVALGMEGDN